jgi:hypothetical protein
VAGPLDVLHIGPRIGVRLGIRAGFAAKLEHAAAQPRRNVRSCDTKSMVPS